MPRRKKSKGSTATSFTLGALIGAGIGYFVITPKGRKLLKEYWKKVEPYVASAKDALEEGVEEGKEQGTKLGEAVQQRIPESIKKPLRKSLFKGL